MINKDRIVPVKMADLLSLYYLFARLFNSGNAPTLVKSADVDGNFTVSTGVSFCDQPAKTINFSGSFGTAYFVPAFDFEGFKVDGAVAEGSAEVDPNDADLYTAVLSDGTITVTMLTPGVVE